MLEIKESLSRLIRTLFKSKQDDVKRLYNKVTWGEELDHSIIVRDDVKLVGKMVNSGWAININNYTKIDVPSKMEFSFYLYEGNEYGYVFDCSLKETIYFLWIPIWKIYYAKQVMKFPKEYLNDSGIASKIYNMIYHGWTDEICKCNSKVLLKKGSKYKVQILHNNEEYPTLTVDERSIPYYDCGADRYPSGDCLEVLNYGN